MARVKDKGSRGKMKKLWFGFLLVADVMFNTLSLSRTGCPFSRKRWDQDESVTNGGWRYELSGSYQRTADII